MKKLVIGITTSGSVNLLEGQLGYFTEKGYETYLLCPEDDRATKFCAIEGCKLLPVRISREISLANDFKSLLEIIKVFRKVQPDIINCGTPKMGLLGILAGRYCKVKYRIYTCRGLRYEFEKGIFRWILKRMEWLSGFFAHKIICISPSLRTRAVSDRIFDEKKCIVINKGSSNGINLKRFNISNVSSYSSLKHKNKLDLEGKFVYGFVGRMYDRKGISELYSAFCEIYKKDTDRVLLFVGPVEYSQIADKRIIDKINRHKGIISVGSQEDIPLFLSIMDVFLLPGWGEGFGNVLVQAAAMGVPVISTRATGTMDAVNDGFNGFLVEPRSVTQLIEKMDFLFENEETRIMMKNNGPLWAENFDNIVLWKAMEKIYNGGV